MKLKIENAVIHRILDVQEFASGFKKRTMHIVIQPDSDYPSYLEVTAVKDNIQLMDMINIGDKVNFEAYIGGREWLKEGADDSETRVFMELKLINVEVLEKAEEEEEEITF